MRKMYDYTSKRMHVEPDTEGIFMRHVDKSIDSSKPGLLTTILDRIQRFGFKYVLGTERYCLLAAQNRSN